MLKLALCVQVMWPDLCAVIMPGEARPKTGAALYRCCCMRLIEGTEAEATAEQRWGLQSVARGEKMLASKPERDAES